MVIESRELQAKTILILAAAVVAALAVLIIFAGQEKQVTIAVLGAIAFPLTIYLSGNQRLFFLFGLVVAAPIGLSLNFLTLIHIGGSPSYSIDLADFFLVPLVAFLLRDFAEGYRTRLIIPPIVMWWFGLILLGCLAIAMGPLRNLSGYETLRMIKGVVIFIVIVNECRRVRQFEFIVLGLGLGVLLQVCVSFVQFVLRRDLGLQALGEAAPEAIAGANLGVYASFDSVYRVGAFMGHPNLLSAYLALLLPVFIALLFTRYGRLVKMSLSVVIVGGCLTLVMTLSRSGWIAFAAAFMLLMVFVFFEPGLRSRHQALKGFLITGAFLMALIVSGPVIQRITQSDPGAIDFRWEWMGVALEMVKDRPILGFGVNTFVYEMAPYSPYGSVRALNELFGEAWPAVHNIYLLVWSEQGTVGLILFLGFHIHLFRIIRKNLRYRIDDRMHALNIGLACGMVALMIDGMASFYIRLPAGSRVFWIAAALIVAIQYWNRSNYPLRLRARQAAMSRGDEEGGAGRPAQPATA